MNDIQFSAGDEVECIDNTHAECSFNIGTTYIVKSCYLEARYYKVDFEEVEKDGCAEGWYASRFKKVTTKPEFFKVGQVVRVICNEDTGLTIGDVCEVIDINPFAIFPICILLKDSYSFWVKADQIKILKPLDQVLYKHFSMAKNLGSKCNHASGWQASQGLFTTWYNCKNCGAKQEDC
jgi:hypothetical protein